MAPKTAAPKPQLVHIQSPGTDNSSHSKAQKEFNRLTTRIANLEKEVATFREAATRLRQRVQNDYRPLQARHNAARASLVRAMDHGFDHYKLTRGEKNKITDIIGTQCADLLDRGHKDLRPIFDKYAPPLTEAEEAASDKQALEMMKQMFTLQYGIEFDPDVDVNTQAKFTAYVDQKFAELNAEAEAEEARATERRAKRKKSPRQQAAEEKKQAETKDITKAVRTLYVDLVKALHPDREPDEAEKLRKTELMKQVTTAYEANELLTLLRLQLELQRIDQSHLENLAEDQLKYYNKLLKEQVSELNARLFDEQQDLSSFTGKPYYYTPTSAAMDYDYEAQKASLHRKIRQTEAEVLAFEHDPAALKAFLKDYKIPKPGPGPAFIRL